MAGAARKGRANRSGSPKPKRKAKSVSRAGDRQNDRRLYLFPDGLLSGSAARRAIAARQALPLAGGPLAFAHLELIERDARQRQAEPFTLPEFERWMASRP